jgi:hypothetical protein
MNETSLRSDMAEAVFRIEGDIAIPSRHAGGPWNPSLQHGSAPASLVAWASEKLPTRVPMRVARMTVDLMRPVPIAPLKIRARVIREGRKIQLCEIRLLAGDREVVRASALKVRMADPTWPPDPALRELDLPLPGAGRDPYEIAGINNPFLEGIQVRVVKGALLSPGPAAVWFRAVRPVIEDIAVSGLMRAAIAADFSNGISSVLDLRAWTFINGDLTVSLARNPIGEWVLVDAETSLSANGGGIAFSRLADTSGYFGYAMQTLIVEPRSKAASPAVTPL